MAQLKIYRKNRLEGVFYLPKKAVVIGRSEGVDIQLLDARVSRRHAVIRESVAGYMIQDMTTKNGTFVNKESVDKSLLFNGDTVIIGAYTLQFVDADASELDSAAVAPLDTGSDSVPALSVPKALLARGASPSPRAQTKAASGGPPPSRVSRLERRGAPSETGRTSIPLIEGLGEGDDSEVPSYGSLDLSSIEIEIK